MKLPFFFPLLIFSLTFNTPAAATIINQSHAGASGANFQSLNWLTLDQTQGMSYNRVISDPAFSGYRYATRAEAFTLISSFFAGATDGASRFAAASGFFSLFGSNSGTSSTSPTFATANKFGFFLYGDPASCSIGRITPDRICQGFVNQNFRSSSLFPQIDTINGSYTVFPISNDHPTAIGLTFSAVTFSSLLVGIQPYAPPPPSAPIPAPSVIWLIVLGSLGLIRFSRKVIKSQSKIS